MCAYLCLHMHAHTYLEDVNPNFGCLRGKVWSGGQEGFSLIQMSIFLKQSGFMYYFHNLIQ